MKRCVVLLLLATLPAEAATLEVVVENLRAAKGVLRVAVCTERTFLAESCGIDARVRAVSGQMTVTFKDVPPGTYAVQAHLDEDSDGQIGRSLFGIPQEGIGFSNDAPFRFGPPSFADAAIALGPAGGRIRLALRYFN